MIDHAYTKHSQATKREHTKPSCLNAFPNQQENDLVMRGMRSGSFLNDQHKQTKQKMQRVESNYFLDVIKAQKE